MASEAERVAEADVVAVVAAVAAVVVAYPLTKEKIKKWFYGAHSTNSDLKDSYHAMKNLIKYKFSLFGVITNHTVISTTFFTDFYIQVRFKLEVGRG